MYEKTPIIKKLKKKFIYSFTKVFFRIIDRFFNVTIEEIIKRKFLNLHSQKYNILENKCYFIHVPKTGGTTFNHHLQINLKKKLFNFNNPYTYNYNTHYPLKKNHHFTQHPALSERSSCARKRGRRRRRGRKKRANIGRRRRRLCDVDTLRSTIPNTPLFFPPLRLMISCRHFSPRLNCSRFQLQTRILRRTRRTNRHHRQQRFFRSMP